MCSWLSGRVLEVPKFAAFAVALDACAAVGEFRAQWFWNDVERSSG